MITVKNYETLIRLPSTPQDEEYAVCTEDRTVYKYLNNEWYKIDASDTKLNINLYELNKTFYNSMPELTFNELKDKQKEIAEWVHRAGGTYFMLLNRERADYTVFHINKSIYIKSIDKEVVDIVCSRGKIKSIEINDKELWIQFWIEDKDKNVFMYAFFPYDSGVIECTTN